jgi:hypothetical protein
MRSTTMIEGRVKWFNKSKEFGLIEAGGQEKGMILFPDLL